MSMAYWEALEGKRLRIELGRDIYDGSETSVIVGVDDAEGVFYVLHTETRGPTGGGIKMPCMCGCGRPVELGPVYFEAACRVRAKRNRDRKKE